MHVSRRLREGQMIIAFALSLFLLLSLSSYHASDPAWSHYTNVTEVLNLCGRVGAWCADILLYAFGYFAYLFPLLIVMHAWIVFSQLEHEREPWFLLLKWVGFVMITAAGCGLISLKLLHAPTSLPFTAGGVLGNVVGFGLARAFNTPGTALLLIATLLTGVTLFCGVSWVQVSEILGRSLFQAARKIGTLVARTGVDLGGWFKERKAARVSFSTEGEDLPAVPVGIPNEAPVKRVDAKPLIHAPLELEESESVVSANVQVRIEPSLSDIDILLDNDARQEPILASPVADPDEQAVIQPLTPRVDKPAKVYKHAPRPSVKASLKGTIPSLNLLDTPEPRRAKHFANQAALEEMARDVEQRLQDFGVSAQVVAVHPGPVITRYELQLAPGVKVSKISGLAKDLARSLSVVGVRVVDVIPGKTVIGIELPNDVRAIVRLKEVFCSPGYRETRMTLPLGLGMDIAGVPVVVDLAKMPHLLVAGTTGSGKSVGLNAMLLSLLYKATPEEIRMILIDPKMLELSMYDGIPHLLTPVVTDMKDAGQALRWCVVEMERRYRLMAAFGVRNLAGFNAKVKAAQALDEPVLDPTWHGVDGEDAPELEVLPKIVVVIDELADMMMVVGKKVEQLIARIAQKARAAGIHMILATQRPSVDVLTGLIKSNIPTRISFQVSSKIDSRTILDQQGAEQLLGHGDMLYLAPGCGAPVRVHGAFVADHEVLKVTNAWKERGEPDYMDSITQETTDPQGSLFVGDPLASEEQSDPLYDQAIAFVTESRRASISSVQRRFKIGYNRAARLIEDMQSQGVVSEPESNGTREVLAPPPPKD